MNTIKSPVEILDAAVKSQTNNIELAKARRAMLKSGKTRTMLINLLAPLVYILGKVGSISIYDYSTKPSIYVAIYDLDSFKQYELVAALEYLTAETDKVNGSITTEDWAAAVNRDFRFRTDKWDVSIHAYVKNDSPTCRKVVVGTEVVEQVKYQIVCD
jgi:hypothetical protein